MSMYPDELSSAGVEMLTQIEGLVLGVYPDEAGYPTIGVGHLLTKSELTTGKIILNDGTVIDYRSGQITVAEAHRLLRSDVIRYEECVKVRVHPLLHQHQYDALVMFTFNVGREAFRNSTLLKRINAMCFDDVPRQMRRWVYSGGKKSNGLRNRREREIALFYHGIYYIR